MSIVHLHFATDILRRFGEELNPNPDQGILELVKNAYDADARECVVTLSSTDRPGGVIEVTDDGDGMEESDIEEGWLVLGRSPKSPTQITRLGRIPAGNKGLGRLAALRMGSRASLITVPRNDLRRQFELNIDWTEFDATDVVENVPLTLHSRPRPNGVQHGTTIRVSGLHRALSRMEIKRLARGLLLLADPFGDEIRGFQPVLKATDFEDLEKLVQNKYFRDAEFHLRAWIAQNGYATAIVTDYRDQQLFEATHDDLRLQTNAPPYDCPAVEFDLWVFILKRESFTARQVTVDEVTTWLREFGGVHLYVNGLRVSPYGNPGNDWLEMNLKRVQHPEQRPSTNTSIGRISVTDLDNRFPQKTDRSGMVEGEAFHDLKRMAEDALNWMARERFRAWQATRAEERTTAPKNVEHAANSLQQEIESLPSKRRNTLRKSFEQYERARDKEAQVLRREVQLYRTLSTAGIAASVFAHESTNPVRLILQNARQIARRAQQHLSRKYKSTLQQPVERILRQSQTLQSFTQLTLSFLDYEKRRIGRVDIHDRIKSVLQVFDSLMKERQVVVTPNLAEGHPYLRGSDAAFESILTNLIVNSLKAFETVPPGSRKIEISTIIENGRLILTVADNGPGIKGIKPKDIWLPGETTYPNGTGLGLAIVHDSVRDLGGRVDVSEKGSLGGAEFIVEVPILGV